MGLQILSDQSFALSRNIYTRNENFFSPHYQDNVSLSGGVYEARCNDPYKNALKKKLSYFFSALKQQQLSWLLSKENVAQVRLEISVPTVPQFVQSQRMTFPELVGGIGKNTRKDRSLQQLY